VFYPRWQPIPDAHSQPIAKHWNGAIAMENGSKRIDLLPIRHLQNRFA